LAARQAADARRSRSTGLGIDAECHDCHHKAVLGFELFLERYGDVTFPEFARLLKCSACGSRRIDVRPKWPLTRPAGRDE
jgi:hypothetical protein